MKRTPSLALIAAILAAAAAPAHAADPAAEYYAGRQITAVVPSSAGGSFDQYMRLMAEHMGKFMPGAPNIIVQNMPGGGGVKSLNYLYNVAPKDGAWLGMPIHTTLTFGLLNPKRVKFLGPDFNWIGSMAGIHDVIGVWKSTGVTSIADARTKILPMGTTGRGGNTFLDIVMANNLLGTKFKVVIGYPGASEINLAIERGELGGHASSWEGLVATQPHWIKSGNFVPIVQLGSTPIADLPKVPSFTSLLINPDDRVVVEVLSVGLTLGRALFATPGVPADRVAALRKAFMAMVIDKAYLADAAKRSMTAHDPLPGEKLQDVVKAAYATSPRVLARAKDALTPK